MPSLRHRSTAPTRRWEDLALEDRHPVEMVTNCARGQQAGDARSDHHRMVRVVRHESSLSRTRSAFVGEIP